MPSQTFFNLPRQKQETLIEIALDEFSSFDYNSASISRIVKKAGIAKGSFYQYFRDKKELYLYLLDLVSEAKLAHMKQTPLPKAEMDFYAYLSWLFEQSINFEQLNPVFSQLSYRAFYGNSSVQDQEIDEIKQTSAKFIRQLVIQGVEAGDINSDLDLDLVVFVVDTLINAFNSYLPQKLGIANDILAEKGSSSLDLELAKKTFDRLIKIVKFGLNNKSEVIQQ